MSCVCFGAYKVGKHSRLHSRLNLPLGPYQCRHASQYMFKGCRYLYCMWERCCRVNSFMASCCISAPLCNIHVKTHSPSKYRCCLLPRDSMPTQGLWKALGLWKFSRNNLRISREQKLKSKNILCNLLPASPLLVTQKCVLVFLLLLRWIS